MGIILLFLAVVAVIAGWWLSGQRLTAKPWLEEGELGGFPHTGAPSAPAAAIGLGVFLAVAGSLFSLLISAYSVRMGTGDWRALALPKLLWFNTGALALASLALLWAQVAVRRGEVDGVRVALSAGGAFTVMFLAGQVGAWRELSANGFFVASNPASTFFCLLTGAHALHVLGGMVALGRSADKAWRGAAPARMRLSVELCGAYWHFLLLVWLVLLGVIAGWADDFITVCRGLLS